MRLFLLILTLCALLRPAPTLAQAPAARLEQQRLRKVVLQLRWDNQFQFAGYYAADWQGYFAEEGLDVEIRPALLLDGRILAVTEEVTAGRADFGVGAADILMAREKGADLRVAASIFQQSAARFYLKQDTPFDSLVDLLNLRVARLVNDLIDVELQAMLRSEGIDPALVTPHPHQAGIDHLLSDAVQVLPGYATTIPFYADKAGQPLREIAPASYGIDFYGDSIFTRGDLVEQDPELVERFVRASLRGWEYALAHPTELADAISQRFERVDTIDDVVGFNRYQADVVQQLILYPVVDLGHVNPLRWEQMNEQLIGLGLVTTSLHGADFVFDPQQQQLEQAQRLYTSLGIGLVTIVVILAATALWVLTLRRAVRLRTQALSVELAARAADAATLQESETRFRMLFLSTPIPTFVWRVAASQFVLADVNPAVNVMTSGMAQRFLGMSAQQIYPDRPDMEERFRTCYEQQTTLVFETSYLARGTGLDRIMVFTFAYVSPELLLLHAEDVTERRQTEAALVSKHANLAALIENTDGSIWSIDRSYGLIIGNATFLRDIQRSFGRELAHGENVLALGADPAVNAEWRGYYDRVFAGESYQVQVLQRYAQGKRWAEFRFSPIRDIAGNVTGATIFGRDITEQKRTETALRTSQANLQALLENTNDAIASVDRNGRLIAFNQGYARMLRAVSSIDAAPGVSILDYLPSETCAKWENVLEQVNTGVNYTTEFVQGTGDDTRFYELSITPIRAGDEILGATAFTHDVTTRKRTELALVQREEDLRQAQRVAHIGNWKWHILTNHLEWSEEMYHIFGIDPVHFTGDLADVIARAIHPADRVAVERSNRSVIEDRQPQPLEYRIIWPDGTERTVWAEAGRLDLDASGAPLLLTGIVQDITERKQAEAERERLLAQLAQAQKMETIGRLAGGIAHDFNNMLAVILLRAEMALTLVTPDTPLHRSLLAIQTTGNRTADLVRQLMGFARIQTIAPQVLDLNATIAGLAPLLRNLIGEDIQLIWQPGLALWPVRLDPSQVNQVLTNLIVNARDAIDGVGTITIDTDNWTAPDLPAEAAEALPPGDYVRLRVSDTGCGMDAATLGHIFDPFFTTKGVGRGTGLGLATVEGIVQQNHGQLRVASQPGQGATFAIYLPRYDESPVPAADAPRAAVAAGRGETILLVEDNAAVLQMALEALEGLGYQVLPAATPGAALEEAARAAAIDLLMTDIIMPEMNGRELATRIAASRPGVKSIFVSGYPADAIAHHGVLEPGVHFLQKPYPLSALATTVREALDSESQSSHG